jgi:cytochrome c oxidase assembly protein subunit 15
LTKVSGISAAVHRRKDNLPMVHSVSEITPEPSNRAVEAWLWSVAALVFAMIVVGGATRLTGSGLSITEWKPILGAIPPLNEADWLAAFEKYKQIPQYALVNAGMTLGHFKFIYAWEWSHRLLGRLAGVAFALPFLAFWAMGKLRQGQPLKLLSVFGLGALQGAIGWYMVSSGLADRVDVSQYRLALHLTVAFLLLATLVWFALDEAVHRRVVTGEAATPAIRTFAAVIVGLVFVQVILGAFVAGLKAGLVYNTWPDMNGQFVPSDYWIGNRGLLSIFESHAAAQFNHRIGAYVLGLVALFQIWQVTSITVDEQIDHSAKALAVVVFIQMTIGIGTLLSHVPLHLGLLHQGCGALVLMVAVWHLYATRNAGSGANG